VHIPVNLVFQIPTSWGDVLTVNAPGIPHGRGDFIVCADAGGYPNLNDRWVVNGEVFPSTYDMRAFPGLSTEEDRKAKEVSIPSTASSNAALGLGNTQARAQRTSGSVQAKQTSNNSNFTKLASAVDNVVKSRFNFKGCNVVTSVTTDANKLPSGVSGKYDINITNYAGGYDAGVSIGMTNNILTSITFLDNKDISRKQFKCDIDGMKQAIATSYAALTSHGFSK
jgi:hypothetical protein